MATEHFILDDPTREKTQDEINRDNCFKRGDELEEMIKNNKIVLPDDGYPIGKEIWILEYGEIPMKTIIRKKRLHVRYPENIFSGILPWVEWVYEVKGKRSDYYSDKLYLTKRDSELARAKVVLKSFYNEFGSLVERNKFTKEDFPELENLTSNLKLLK